MGVWEIIIGALVLLLSVVMIIVIILQEGHDAGLGTITGGADSFAKRGKAKTADAMFAKITKFVAIGFFVFVVVLNAISYFGGKNSSDNGTAIISSDESSVVSEVSADEGETSAQTSEETSAASQTSEETSVTSEASEETSVVSQASEETSAASEVSEQASTVSETSEEPSEAVASETETTESSVAA